jgi:membrane-associated HD superfamily phosphohydrolase
MLEDNKVAKLFLSAIIGEEIVELEFSAQERVVEMLFPKKKKKNENVPLTVCRIDFSAKIKTETGFKTVIIELQKAKYLSDLMRFRRYLGLHYQNPNNTSDEQQQRARPIYCIYFLAFGMDLPPRPVLKVYYKVQDVYTGDEFPASGEFVSGLHHRSWIVQINQLKKHRRNDLERLLSIFDQSSKTDIRYILDVDDESFPEAYRQIIRRLRKAMEDPQKRREMELEDDIIKELQDKERQIEKKTKEVEEKNKTIADMGNTITGMENTIADKDRKLEEQDKALAELEKELAKYK